MSFFLRCWYDDFMRRGWVTSYDGSFLSSFFFRARGDTLLGLELPYVWRKLSMSARFLGIFLLYDRHEFCVLAAKSNKP